MTVWKSHCRGPYPPFLNGGERRQHRKTGRNPVGGCVRKYGRGGDCGCRSFTLVEPRSRPHFDGRLYSCSREAGSPIVPNHRSNCHPGQQRAAALALALVPPRAMRRKTTMMMGWMCCTPLHDLLQTLQCQSLPEAETFLRQREPQQFRDLDDAAIERLLQEHAPSILPNPCTAMPTAVHVERGKIKNRRSGLTYNTKKKNNKKKKKQKVQDSDGGVKASSNDESRYHFFGTQVVLRRRLAVRRLAFLADENSHYVI